MLVSGTSAQLDGGAGAVESATTYNAFGEVASKAYTWETGSASTALLDREYTYDSSGLIVGVVERDSNGCTTVGEPCTYKYDYDDQGRLWKVWKYDWLATAYDLEKTYEYDANGNRTKLDWADPARTDEVVPTVSGGAFDIGPRDEVGSYGERTNITYNNDGQTTGWDEPGAMVALTYDRADHLLEVSKSGTSGFNVEYRYDAAGRRVERIEGGVTTHRWVWRGSRLIAEYAGSMALRKQFVYAEFPHVPSVIIDHSGGSAVKYRVVHDQLGSVRKVVSMADGSVVQELKYDEFGRVTDESAQVGFEQPFGFAGGLYEPTTKLTRFGVRDYDPYLGRWLTQDPLSFGAGDTNLYRYVYGSPLSYVDVDGRLGLLVTFVVAGAVAAMVTGIYSAISLGQQGVCEDELIRQVMINSGAAFFIGGFAAMIGAVVTTSAVVAEAVALGVVTWGAVTEVLFGSYLVAASSAAIGVGHGFLTAGNEAFSNGTMVTRQGLASQVRKSVGTSVTAGLVSYGAGVFAGIAMIGEASGFVALWGESFVGGAFEGLTNVVMEQFTLLDGFDF
jgi:RHS repeat-associated protein